MNEHLNAAIVRSAYEAFANGDGPRSRRYSTTTSPGTSPHLGLRATTTGATRHWLFGRVVQEVEGIKMSPLHDVLASDDHVVVLHEWTATRNGHTLNGQYADVYHLRNGKATEHWHLAVDPKAEEAFWAS